ncbi:MAG: ATP-binding protein [Candidatus Aegiribacteria sp.]|nr:ATP-binding protein [Candidatus Aegiribacteria sp.]
METLYLERLINDQRDELLSKDTGTPREVSWRNQLNLDRIVAVTGIRRCGKSTLLRQIAEYFGSDFNYINFDDLRLTSFSESDYDIFLTIFSKSKKSSIFLFDEIQLAPAWERYLRKLHDLGYNIVITGSNSSLLSNELGSHLTGRYIQQELFPFSFNEFLDFRSFKRVHESTDSVSRLMQLSKEYIFNGGFPEFLKHNRRELLEQTYRDIIYRDIIARYGIQERQAFRELAQYLMSNPGIKITYGKLAKQLGFRSSTSVKEYISHMEDVYLLFQIHKFDWSLKRSLLAPRKVYPVDNGLSHAVAFRLSPNRGHLLETAVFNQLRRFGSPWYYADRKECDFVIENRDTGYQCIQVCWHLEGDNQDRELGGLQEAMNYFDSGSGTIVTYDQERTVKLPEGRTARLVPFWRWAKRFGHTSHE